MTRSERNNLKAKLSAQLWNEYHALRREAGAIWEAYGRMQQEVPIPSGTLEVRALAESIDNAREHVRAAIDSLKV